jgi:hypothetical protein
MAAIDNAQIMAQPEMKDFFREMHKNLHAGKPIHQNAESYNLYGVEWLRIISGTAEGRLSAYTGDFLQRDFFEQAQSSTRINRYIQTNKDLTEEDKAHLRQVVEAHKVTELTTFTDDEAFPVPVLLKEEEQDSPLRTIPGMPPPDKAPGLTLEYGTDDTAIVTPIAGVTVHDNHGDRGLYNFLCEQAISLNDEDITVYAGAKVSVQQGEELFGEIEKWWHRDGNRKTDSAGEIESYLFVKEKQSISISVIPVGIDGKPLSGLKKELSNNEEESTLYRSASERLQSKDLLFNDGRRINFSQHPQYFQTLTERVVANKNAMEQIVISKDDVAYTEIDNLLQSEYLARDSEYYMRDDWRSYNAIINEQRVNIIKETITRLRKEEREQQYQQGSLRSRRSMSDVLDDLSRAQSPVEDEPPSTMEVEPRTATFPRGDVAAARNLTSGITAATANDTESESAPTSPAAGGFAPNPAPPTVPDPSSPVFPMVPEITQAERLGTEPSSRIDTDHVDVQKNCLDSVMECFKSLSSRSSRLR